MREKHSDSSEGGIEDGNFTYIYSCKYICLENIQTPMGKRTIFNAREAYENADLEQKYDFFFCSSRFKYEDIWRRVNGVQDVQLTYVPVNVGKVVRSM